MPTNAPHHVFVYGTLKRGERNHALFARDASVVRPGEVAGSLLHLPAGYPGFVRRQVRGTSGTVHGELMRFPDIDTTLRRLDGLEDYRPDAPDESLYLRETIAVVTPDTTAATTAWIYVYAASIDDGATPVPDGRWSSARYPFPA